MYLYKLMFRSLMRHGERGRRLAILIGLCTAAIVFLLAMMESFSERYVKLFVDTTTAHLSIVHPDAAELKRKPWKRGPAGLPLIRADSDLIAFLEADPAIEAIAPLIRAMGQFSVLSGEEQGATTMIGIDPERLTRVYPGVRVDAGEIPALLHPDPGTRDVPVLRRSVQFWETTKVASDRIAPADLRVRGKDLQEFMGQVRAAFPSRFTGGASVEQGTFLAALGAALADPALYREIPEARRAKYDWRLEEIVSDARDLSPDDAPQRIRNTNKQLLAALFPDALSPVSESIALRVPMTFQTGKARDQGKIQSAVVVPVEFTGFAETMPLYGFESYMQIEPLADFLELKDDEVTEIAIRLRDAGMTETIKARIRTYLESRGLDYDVLDYQEMGSGYMPTALGFAIGLGVLVGLFAIAVIVFVTNMILLSIIKRRREIGTALVLGMSRREYALVLLGEIAAITLVAWVGGAVLGSLAVALFATFGMPGVVFFQDGLLYFDWSSRYALLALALVLPSAILATLIPASSILKLRPAEVLRETK